METDDERKVFRVADMADDDRPREKALRYGVKTLSAVELIAIALGSGMVGKSVLDVSREIMESIGNEPASLARMSIHSLIKNFKGIGEAKAVQLMAAVELGMRVSSRASYAGRDSCSSSEEVYHVMRDLLRHEHEEMWVLVLDRRNRIKDKVCISRGGLTATVVDIRMVFATALERLATAIILVHNHPSGNKQPSREDDVLTKRIKDAGNIIDIKLLDHLIITEDGYYSYNDNGRLN